MMSVVTLSPSPTAVDAAAVARLAHLLADDTRAAMCLALLDGRAWTAGELARATGVSASTASAHLDQLVVGGLLTEERQGRHRYLTLAGPGAADLVEDLAGRARAELRAAPASLRGVSAANALAEARTCHDHLAGRLGVALLDALCRNGFIDRDAGLAVTSRGLGWLADLGVDVTVMRGGRRPVVRQCLDWTERRHHLAGAVGAAICERMLAQGWIERTPRPRAVRVTTTGAAELRAQLGLSL
jgi:DNA-binding transcriptional ArsR family regulator